MLEYVLNLPVHVVSRHILGYFELKDLVWLERACSSRTSRQWFLQLSAHCPAVSLDKVCFNELNHTKKTFMWIWCSLKKLRIESISISLPDMYHQLFLNLLCDKIYLHLDAEVSLQHIEFIKEYGSKVSSLRIMRKQRKAVMQKLSTYIPNVTTLHICESTTHTIEWLTEEVVSNWKLQSLIVKDGYIEVIMNIIKHCTELTYMYLQLENNINDAAVTAIAQHCPKLQKLILDSRITITYNSLIALSEQCLFLKELDIPSIPNIPTADIARRCSHTLSCIRQLFTIYLYRKNQDASILIPYMTGLSIVYLDYYFHSYIPLLTQHCHKLTEIAVTDKYCSVSDILSLCCANPLLQKFDYGWECCITDTALIELIHACPHLHTLRLPYETNITDIGILALSEHCPPLQWLDVSNCKQITEAAILQLLQRCRKLTRLEVSSSSLSEETWTQLDSNIQKRVSRY